MIFLLFSATVASAATVRGDLSTRFPAPRTYEWDGVTYRYRQDLKTVLFIGVDSTAESEAERVGFRSGGQSDFMLLVVLDATRDAIYPIQIDRDVMTPVTIVDVLGNPSGERVLQLCLSHGFGDGREQSCRFTCDAVSNLLLGVDVDYYVAMNLDAIPVLNDAVGGVTVTVAASDDFTALDPTMFPGSTLTLRGKQAEYFVRNRLSIGEGTNAARMVRQRAYMAEFGRIVQEKVQASANFMGTLFDEMEPYLVTDMRRGAMINMAWASRNYTRVPTLTLEGEHTIGEDGFVEFHADESALRDLVLEVFYEPMQ